MAENFNWELSFQTNYLRVIKKKLKSHDLDRNGRLRLPKREFEQLIIPEMEWELIQNLKNSVEVIVKDVRGIAYHVTLIKYNNGDYYFLDKWKDIVRAKGLKLNDEITFWWDSLTENFYIM